MVAAYLMGYQLLPYDHCAEAMSDLFGCQVSPGTLITLLKGCAGELAGAELVIKEGLRRAAVLGVDETGLRVSKRQDWVHVSATVNFTLLAHDRRRGEPAVTRTIRFSRNGPVVDDILPAPARETGPITLKWLGVYQGGWLTSPSSS